MVGFDKSIIDKWTPIIDRHLNIKNPYFKYLCCHYFDFLYLEKGDVSEDILNFKESISSLKQFKISIEKEYINLLTGRKEYLLSNGVVFDPDSYDIFLTTNELIKIFGIEFITHLDPVLSRDFKIETILKDDNRK
jgi:hypothetical protein